MKLEDLKLKTVLYYMEKFLISAGGKELDLPRTQIGAIQISKSFDTEVYPLVYISANVPYWFYKEMTKNKDSLSVTMNLQYVLNDNVESFHSGKGTFMTEYSGKYKVVIPYNTQAGDDTDQKILSQEDGSIDKSYTFGEYCLVEMLIYNESYYKAAFTKMQGCNVLSNGTDIVTYICNKHNLNNILFGRHDGGYGLIHGDKTVIQNLMQLVDAYGLHSEGSVVFFDLDYGYILPKRAKCIAWRNNEYKATYIYSTSDFSEGLSEFSGVYLNGEEKISVIAIQKDAFMTDNIAETPSFINTKQTEFVKFVTSNAMFNLLTPNKEFVLSIDSPTGKDLNGKYRIYSVECNMAPRGEYLEPSFTVLLRR